MYGVLVHRVLLFLSSHSERSSFFWPASALSLPGGPYLLRQRDRS